MRVLLGGEPLLTPGVDSIAAQHNRKTVQILPLLTVTGITLGVATRTEGLTASLTLHHQFSSQFIQDLQQVAQTISSFKDKLTPWQWWYSRINEGYILQLKKGGLASSSKRNDASMSINGI